MSPNLQLLDECSYQLNEFFSSFVLVLTTLTSVLQVEYD